VFTARYAPSPYIKQTRFVLKGLIIRNLSVRDVMTLRQVKRRLNKTFTLLQYCFILRRKVQILTAISVCRYVMRTRCQISCPGDAVTCEAWLPTCLTVSCFAVRTTRWLIDRSASGRAHLISHFLRNWNYLRGLIADWRRHTFVTPSRGPAELKVMCRYICWNI
jgi:hypothetical protein